MTNYSDHTIPGVRVSGHVTMSISIKKALQFCFLENGSVSFVYGCGRRHMTTSTNPIEILDA